MPGLTINIVSFDIPYPANYGGAIDVFYKIKALRKNNVHVILHCFQYNKPQQQTLEKYCKQVFYYKRPTGFKYLFSNLPYIVITRKNPELLKNLQDNNHPILFEGLHSCGFLSSKFLKDRIKLVRTHNIEHDYYKGLQKATKRFSDKLYFAFESKKLKKFEPTLEHATSIFSISPEDTKYFSLNFKQVNYVPAFHSCETVTVKPGKGTYFLYHGNLDVEENQKAIYFLINQVFVHTNAKLVVAGKNSGSRIAIEMKKLPNSELISNPSPEQIDDLIENAQACVLPTFQATGLKLKLLISLFKSRHIIVNGPMVENTGLENLCLVANSANQFISKINETQSIDFTQKMIENRKQKLASFSNQTSGEKLTKILKSIC